LPVCGVGHKTYLNLCTIKCKGVRLAAFGECKQTVNPADTCKQCSDLNNSICGTDGKNYKNECLCVCQGTCKKYSDGKCPDPNAYKCQRCVGVLSKVCGVDNKTYDNYCFLQCAGVELSYHGECAQNTQCNGNDCYNN